MRLLYAKSASPHHGFAAYYTYVEKIFGADAAALRQVGLAAPRLRRLLHLRREDLRRRCGCSTPSRPRRTTASPPTTPTSRRSSAPMRLLYAKSASPHHGFAAYYTYVEKIFGA